MGGTHRAGTLDTGFFFETTETTTRRAPSTLVVNIKHVEAFFGDRCAARIKTHDIEQYKDHRKAQHAANSTINLELAAIRRAFTLGYDRGLVASRPKVICYRVGNRNARKGFFEREQYEALLSELPAYMKPILKFGYISGWREGEIFGLRWAENYDADANVIRLYDTKNEEWRTFPLDGGLVEIIEEQKARRRGELIFHHDGCPCNRSTFNKHWRRACGTVGITLMFHDLRRTAVRNLIRAGVPRVVAMKITGHKTESIFNRYDIVDEQDIRTALGKVRAYLI